MKKLLVLSALLLAGCVSKPVAPSDVVVTEQMRKSGNWTQYADILYNPVMACLNAHPSQPAFAGEVMTIDAHKTAVQLSGKDGRVYDCQIENIGKAPLNFKLSRAADFRGPAFYPPAWGAPESTRCNWIDRLSTADGRLLGWISSNLCGPDGKVPLPPKVSAETFLGREWVAEDIDGHGVIDNSHSSLQIATDGKLSGDTGCNRMTGAAKIDGANITFGPIASTRRMCLAPAMADQEAKYTKTLEKVRGWRVENEILFLSDSAGKDILRFSEQN